jgi:hypothetical protein
MVCYSRAGGKMAALFLIVFLAFGRVVSHFLGEAVVLVAITLATAGASIAAALVFAAFLTTRRNRAAAGGCVSCTFRCQHAMTEQPRRLVLVSSVDRSAAPRSPEPVAPRWPDRPAFRSVSPRAPAADSRRVRQRERAGSAD